MSEERAVSRSSHDQVRRALSPSTPISPRRSAKNWLNASTWKESAYLAESTKRTSPTPTSEAANFEGSDPRDEAPLDFSMKKRKANGGVETDDILAQADAAAATYGLMKAFFERRASAHEAENSSVPTGVSTQFCLANRRAPSTLFPLSMAAAAAAASGNNRNGGVSSQENLGATVANRRHFFTQQLLQKHDQDDFDGNHGESLRSRSNNSSTVALAPDGSVSLLGTCASATPPAIQSGAIPSPQNGHRNSQQQKIQRPFKAYNPMDPMSALQVGAALGPSAIPFLNAFAPPAAGASAQSSPHLLLPNPLTSPASTASPNALPPLLNAQLLSQYRQYLINAQAAAAVAALRAKSTQHLQQQLQQSTQLHPSPDEVPSQAINNSSQSPPQVTSTSHPHTAESSSSSSSAASPPSPNITTVANGNTPISAIIRKNGLDQAKIGNGPDRRISSGSGSGGSSFNGGEEDDEEMLHEHDDGGSNRSSPTPSCASSIAPRRTSLQVHGDVIGADIMGMHKNGNGTGSKSENGSNGSSGRRKGRSLPDSLKDEAYWERRRKNNEAAKRSRDARRAKEDEIAIRAALLEQENMRLRIEVAALKAETDKLRQMLLNT